MNGEGGGDGWREEEGGMEEMHKEGDAWKDGGKDGWRERWMGS